VCGDDLPNEEALWVPSYPRKRVSRLIRRGERILDSRTRTDKEFTLKVISKYTREKDPKILSETYDYYSKDAFEKLPYVTDEGMKMVFEQMSDSIPGWKDLKASSFVGMRILKDLDGSGFVQQLYGSK
jgi:hypothetical protein